MRHSILITANQIISFLIVTVVISQLYLYYLTTVNAHTIMDACKQRMAYATVITGENYQFECVNAIYSSCANCGVSRDDWFLERIGMRMWYCSSCNNKENLSKLNIEKLEAFHRSLIRQSTIDYINRRPQQLSYVDLRCNPLYISFHPEITAFIEHYFKGTDVEYEIVPNYVLDAATNENNKPVC